ncbi:hypothetical protein J4448_00365 [Candidatus Woesearchaeota archaeon]|nr:hypothetical protein [Candidatus Woesearchaeota archaeon]
MNWKILSIIVLIIAGVVGYAIVNQQTPSPAPIPTPTPNGEKIIRGVGESESSFLIQKINLDSVEGLWYNADPVPRPEGTPRTLRIGDDIGYTCEGISEKLTSIDFSDQKVTFTKIVGERPLGGCPICLSGSTLIDTPNGNINIKELRSGMLVWTSDSLGHRQPAIILKIGKAQVPPTHKMVHIILNNGKELFASQGHPTADGRIFGDIKPDDIIDDSYVKSVKIVQYDQKYTYDILPSGDTGFYWANGILVGGTLK